MSIILGPWAAAYLEQHLNFVDVCSHAQLAGRFGANQLLVTSNHLDLDALSQAALDGLRSVVPGGGRSTVEQTVLKSTLLKGGLGCCMLQRCGHSSP